MATPGKRKIVNFLPARSQPFSPARFEGFAPEYRVLFISRTLRRIGQLAALWLPGQFRGTISVQSPLVPPDANAGSRLDLELFQNVLHVLLDGARTAFENFSDLVVALAGNDPLDDFEFATGQIRRLGLGYTKAL
jgi:hypothetical protein